MSLKVLRQVRIVCDKCGFYSSHRHDLSEQQMEELARCFGWRTTTPGSPLMCEAQHLCPPCAKEAGFFEQ